MKEELTTSTNGINIDSLINRGFISNIFNTLFGIEIYQYTYINVYFPKIGLPEVSVFHSDGDGQDVDVIAHNCKTIEQLDQLISLFKV